MKITCWIDLDGDIFVGEVEVRAEELEHVETTSDGSLEMFGGPPADTHRKFIPGRLKMGLIKVKRI